MKKRWILLSGVSIIIALTGMVAYADESYTIATDTVFKPFEYLDEHGEFVGIDVDILAAIAQDQGFEYELNSLGWDASIAACQAKQADGPVFQIPFDRQSLADYLCVDRSAMSAELSKLKREGILDFHRSTFRFTGTAGETEDWEEKGGIA